MPAIAKPDLSPARLTNLSYGNAMRPEELRALDLFTRHFLIPLKHFSPFVELPDLVVQICMWEPTVLQAMLAMTHAHADHFSVHDTTQMGMRNPARPIDATLHYYNRAITAMNVHINDAIAHKASIVPILLSSMLLMCYELFQAKFSLAQKHMSNLKRIAFAYPRQHGANCVGTETRAIIREVQESFRVLDLGRLDLEEDSKADNVIYKLLAEMDDLVDESQSFRRELIDHGHSILAHRSLNGLSNAMQHCLASLLGRTACLKQHRKLQLQLQRLLGDHERWKKRFDEAKHTNSDDRLTYEAELQHHFSYHALKCLQPDTSATEASYEEECTHMLEVATQYLQTFETSFKEPNPYHFLWREPRPTIGVNHSVLRTLYFIATKCTSRAIRKTAIQLLLVANRREGLVPSSLLSSFAQTLDDILLKKDTPSHLLSPHSYDEVVSSDEDSTLLPDYEKPCLHTHQGDAYDEVVSSDEPNKPGSIDVFYLVLGRILRDGHAKPYTIQITEYRCARGRYMIPKPNPDAEPWVVSARTVVHLEDLSSKDITA
ncbi:hypothetical protein AMS68_002657 [Peltaster fructicola]|uniref:Uncharacterized protein n=1 Tax=Peltaster fructicola TaxID=286661 RepID=A0A6H0XRP6_9PEZI|nr:hypothetical protein AMS68_002657 [Peltaster fructicola]